MKVVPICVVSLLSALIFCGCAIEKKFIDPLPQTFLEGVDVSQKMERLPLGHSAVVRGADFGPYNKILVKPVRYDLLPDDAWVDSAGVLIRSKEEYVAESKLIAAQFTEKLKTNLRNTASVVYQLTDTPDQQTIAIEIALTELVFAKPTAEAGALAIPVPGVGTAVSALIEPHMAFAAKVTDAKTGKLMATAADRKFPPLRLVDLNKFKVTSSAREICENWAQIIADIFAKGKMEKVESRGVVSIMPW